MILEVARERQRLNDIFALVSKLPYEEEPLAHWARYLCVLTSGLLENSLRLMLGDYVKRRSDPRVASFAIRHIERITNLNEERVAQLLGSFSEEWRKAFVAAVTEEQKSALDSIVANRNNIAHGRPVGITVARVREYYERINEVLDWIDVECVS